MIALLNETRHHISSAQINVKSLIKFKKNFKEINYLDKQYQNEHTKTISNKKSLILIKLQDNEIQLNKQKNYPQKSINAQKAQQGESQKIFNNKQSVFALESNSKRTLINKSLKPQLIHRRKD
ncbi:hypothetical protein ABPG74_007102 [Tetrahymena malaccensis]